MTSSGGKILESTECGSAAAEEHLVLVGQEIRGVNVVAGLIVLGAFDGWFIYRLQVYCRKAPR